MSAGTSASPSVRQHREEDDSVEATLRRIMDDAKRRAAAGDSLNLDVTVPEDGVDDMVRRVRSSTPAPAGKRRSG